jgi:hypothetical protein
MNKILLVALSCLVFLNACALAQTANPGEVIYQYVSGQADALFAGTGALTLTAAQQIGTSLVTYFSSQSTVAPGYGNLKFQSAPEISPGTREMTFVAQKNDRSNQIQSVWRVVDRGSNYVGVFAITKTTDSSVNVVNLENAAFGFLDRIFKRISSAR